MYVSFSDLSKGLLLTVVQIFHCFLTGRFHGRAGQAYIEDGEYIFSDSKGKEIITKSNWAAKIQIGMTFEMSIVVQKSRSLASTFGSQTEQCPRCNHACPKAQSSIRMEWKVAQVIRS